MVNLVWKMTIHPPLLPLYVSLTFALLFHFVFKWSVNTDTDKTIIRNLKQPYRLQITEQSDLQDEDEYKQRPYLKINHVCIMINYE